MRKWSWVYLFVACCVIGIAFGQHRKMFENENVGIGLGSGTNIPAERLHIRGNARIDSAVPSGYNQYLNASGLTINDASSLTNIYGLGAAGTITANPFGLMTSNAERWRVGAGTAGSDTGALYPFNDAIYRLGLPDKRILEGYFVGATITNGTVGIGTTTPAAPLHVVGRAVKDSGTGETYDIDDLAWSILANRVYHRETNVVSGTISNVVANITTANFSNRWIVRVPNGYYGEETIDLSNKPYIDIIGQSRTGVVVASSSTNLDTFKVGGASSLLGNMTIHHTNAASDPATFYPIHHDANTSTNNRAANHFLLNLTCKTFGTGGKSGLGVGIREGQTLTAVNCSFESSASVGLNFHNTASSALPARIDLVHCTAIGVGGTGWGLSYINFGSTQPDVLNIIGGSYTGSAGGIIYTNSGAGTNETILFISDNPTLTSVVMTDTSRRMNMRMPPPFVEAVPVIRDWTRTLVTGPRGWTINENGNLYPNLIGNKVSLSPDQLTYYKHVFSSGEDYAQLFVGNFQHEQHRAGISSTFYYAVVPGGNNTIPLGTVNFRWQTGYFSDLNATNAGTAAAPIGTNFATMAHIRTNAIIANPIAGYGTLWNSNSALYWITSTKTNLLTDGL